MARPEENLWFLGRTFDLKLEIDFAPKSRAPENERASWRFIEFDWWLIRFWRDLIKNLEQSVTDFRAGQLEMLAHLVDELPRAKPMASFRLPPGHPDRLIRRVPAKKSLLEDLIALLRRVAREMFLLVQPLGIGDPAVPEALPDEGAHPSHLHGII